MDRDRPVLLDPGFQRLWLSNTASGLATWALPFVLGLAIVSGDLDAVAAGWALAARTLGFVLAMPVGGVLADRIGPRKMILIAGLIAALGVVPIIFALVGPGGFVVLVIGAGVAGFGQGACRASFQAIIPSIVAAQSRQSANAALTISIRVTTLIGPALATWSMLKFGAMVTLALIILLWLISAVLPPWRKQAGSPSKAAQLTVGRFVLELREGLAEARRHPWFVAGLGALTLVIAFGYSVTNVILPQVSDAHFGGPALMAVSLTAYTVGALAGAMLIARWRPDRIGWIALMGLALYGVVPLSLLYPHGFILPVIAYFLAGVGIELFNVPWFTATQREVPADRLARVSSIDFLFSYGLAPIALAGLTPLTTAFGTPAVLVLCSGICIAAPLLAMCVKSSRGFSQPAAEPNV